MNTQSNDFWSQFESPQENQPKSNDFWSQFEEPTDQIEKGPEQAIASFGAHALGALTALPGNLINLGKQAGEASKNLKDTVLNKLGVTPSGYEPPETALDKPLKAALDFFPTSAEVNKAIDESFGGYLAPKNEYQKVANEVGEDVVNSLVGGGPRGIVRNLVIPSAATAIRKGAEILGASPEIQNDAKMVTWVGLDLMGLSNPRQFLSQQINQTARRIKPNDIIRLNPNDFKFLDGLENKLKSGGTRPSTAAALTKVEELKKSIQGTNIPARNIYDFYRSVNELKTNYGAFNVEGAAKPGHVFNLNKVQDFNRNLLTRYGRRSNPEFIKEFKDLNSGWAALEQSDAIANYVKKHYNKPVLSEAARMLFHNAGFKGAAVIGGLGALERIQATMQRLNNPILRRYYGDILRASLTQNAPAMIHNLKKFDETAKKEEDRQGQGGGP